MAMIVIKAGGALLDDAAHIVAGSVAHHTPTGGGVVLVHGGGPQLDRAAAAQGVPSRRVGGRRITSPELLELAVGEWRGRASVAWVAALHRVGIRAVGVCGLDGGLIHAVVRPSTPVDFGLVGDIVAVHPGILHALMQAGCVPVVAPLACGPDAQPLNVNADTVAAAIATAIGAERLLMLSNTALRSDPRDPTSVVSHIDPVGLDRLAATGCISDGMEPKLAAARMALTGGVPEVHLLDGRNTTKPGTVIRPTA